jgi:hypothetical protein
LSNKHQLGSAAHLGHACANLEELRHNREWVRMASARPPRVEHAWVGARVGTWVGIKFIDLMNGMMYRILDH